MSTTNSRRFVGDFETTVYEGQTFTEVWASALVEIGSEDVVILHSIGETFDYLVSLNCNLVVYYHNLKFDGSFWLDYLLNVLQYKQATLQWGKEYNQVAWLKTKEMPNKSFKYSISFMGSWYTITIKINNHTIELRDSLKLLPFTVKAIGDAFKTKHRKLEIEYKGFRYAGCEITSEEQKYIANDVLVVKEALETMFEQGHNKLTIGACCLSEFKRGYDKQDYNMFFPDLYELKLGDITLDNNEHIEFKLPKDENGNSTKRKATIGDYIHKSYRGGWCYLVKGKENRIYHKGITADVNSLYPSMMSSESGNRYPVGLPIFWKGNYIPEKALADNKYYFVHIRCRFYLKKNKLPFIQIKNNKLYKATEMLETSDVYNKSTGKYQSKYMINGVEYDTIQDMYLTMTDYQLLLEHYKLEDAEIIDGCYFCAEIGLFDEYIEKYKKIKLESKGALRTLAKLFLNNLYGKMASSKDSSFKYAFIRDDGSIGFTEVEEYDKEAGYIAIGSAITSYARNFTIRGAQANYYGKDKAGFIYADTDSIHCDLPAEQIKGIKVHDKNFCCWKLESSWDNAIFVRQKTYIEHVTHEDLVPLEQLTDKEGNSRSPYYNIKCAGMPQRCKDLFERSLSDKEITEDELQNYNAEQIRFLFDTNGNQIHRKLTDFKIGLKVAGKLVPKRIKGGTLLVETDYTMR